MGATTNVTISLDEETLRLARIRALEQGTSVNALVREYLEALVGGDRSARAGRRFVARTAALGASGGPTGRTWSRGDLYEP